MLLERESYAYTSLWDTLTVNQKRLLKGLSLKEEPLIFSAEFLNKHKLGSPSNGQRVIKTLMKKDIIDHHNSSYKICDKFLRLWINKNICESSIN